MLNKLKIFAENENQFQGPGVGMGKQILKDIELLVCFYCFFEYFFNFSNIRRNNVQNLNLLILFIL